MNVQCDICPNNCNIADGTLGICKVRGARDGKIYLPFNGIISSTAVDPVEKKPLYHFFPGSGVFSIGFYGCSLSCPFCQNYRISKEFKISDYSDNKYTPEQIIDSVTERGLASIAYTYSEPVVHFEWIVDCASKASAAGLKNILVTNGYVNPEPGKELLRCMDAVNIDLKSFNDNFYRKELKGQLEPVLNFIKSSVESSVHVELTTLVINGKNDSMEEISAARDFIAGLSEYIPWHLSAYYPAYKYSTRPTPAHNLEHLAEFASEKLEFVYTGNITGGKTDTICPSCGNTLIVRSGYRTSLTGIADKKCNSCGTDLSSFGIIL